MNLFLVVFAIVLLVAQLALPRRFAFLPLLIAAIHFPNSPIIDIGSVSLSTARLLILAGLIRSATERLGEKSPRSALDSLMLCWACWAVLSTFGHNPKDCNPLTIRLRTAFDLFGAFLYARSYLRDYSDFLRFSKCLAVLLVLLAIPMIGEKLTGRNPYAMLGESGDLSDIRRGRIRAKGPFGGAILAGTAGATLFPLVLALRPECPRFAIAGTAACGLIVFCSGSSGPIGSLFFGAVALAVWPWRTRIRLIRRIVICGLLAMHVFMQAPVWYLLARIDLVGGSTGWHRAELITQALNHLNEWWMVGTDETRSWMPYGIEWSASHTDITNYYIWMGVMGGLPLMLLFVAILIKAFQLLGREIRVRRSAGDPVEFSLWCVGSALFAHSLTFLTIVYYDQNFVFLCFVLGAVPGLCTGSAWDAARVPVQSVETLGVEEDVARTTAGAL